MELYYRRTSFADVQTMNRTELATAAARGDTESFTTLLIRYHGLAVDYAYANLGDFHLAEDVSPGSLSERP